MSCSIRGEFSARPVEEEGKSIKHAPERAGAVGGVPRRVPLTLVAGSDFSRFPPPSLPPVFFHSDAKEYI